jgi:hypothetical protein
MNSNVSGSTIVGMAERSGDTDERARYSGEEEVTERGKEDGFPTGKHLNTNASHLAEVS